MHINATYDNTMNNPYNPNVPPQTVSWGEGTTDEMYLVGMTYVPYEPGDEDIVIGGSTPTTTEEVANQLESRLFFPFPNPANGNVALSFYLQESQNISIELFDVKGTSVKRIIEQAKYTPGNHSVSFNVEQLPAGMYTIKLSGVAMILNKPLVVSE